MANESLAKAPFLAVGAAPHWHCGRTIHGMMRDYLIALMPAVAMAVYMYGLDALRVMALSCVTAVVIEAVCLKAMERDVTVDDNSALLQGLLLAFLLPASAPWWLVILGSAFTILLGRLVFGGLGANPVCAPLVGWAILSISWKLEMDIDAAMLNTMLVNPLTQLKYFGAQKVADISYTGLLAGQQLGALGSSQVGALLLGGIYLLVRRTVRWQLPAAFFGGVLLISGIFYAIDSSQYASPLFHLLTGSVVFGAFFLVTDSSSSPVGKAAMVIFGLLAGGMVVTIRVYGMYPDGVPFAILLANMTSPLLDMIRPKPFGAR
ncbi:NADH:quinone oxidoreductase subunit RnfD [Oleidesulfovibrio alaskensis G20]|jgi:electron transport complex protein RnfD|uniref:Ion-translocating oxidoreductase complex subunit D n=1 Tax=Oleidesulfovibrio alaskensis (strain ATCC BAA-1058 / DSM 17464 / G20) TaxID=207559 RepID=Q315L3_OLEA2|nr:RnfABCDGE type electron transport complex subunit D [Oleidesulfovibrio alaskensis]ABB37383.1 NADH:quinone oxidoreductase subunit RnfD [Oleidesulfovibrio alaskensis G20]MBG0774253.1 RnfABCDGE type electron transport complex subunit D [Oleidesulfovibrio alaskensis]MBL3583151.1 RnfABCDGE type electron transport complex subunit D [Oleidesulfovibrio alaskensis]